VAEARTANEVSAFEKKRTPKQNDWASLRVNLDRWGTGASSAVEKKTRNDLSQQHDNIVGDRASVLGNGPSREHSCFLVAIVQL
jgi:hypothetical protein